MKAAATLIENTVSAKIKEQLEITITTLSLGGYWPVMPQTTCYFHFLLGIPNCSVILITSLHENTQFLVNCLFFYSYLKTTTNAKLTPASLRPSSKSFSESPVHKRCLSLPACLAAGTPLMCPPFFQGNKSAFFSCYRLVPGSLWLSTF